MKLNLSVLCAVFLVASCNNQPAQNANELKKQVDSLTELVQKIKPGLGEYMLSVQIHHNKLWFAGKTGNWKLADFEYGEIKEVLTSAQDVETDRPEVKSVPMIYPSLDSINNAISKKDTALFRKSFELLTNTCNTCHRLNHFEFNRIKIPDAPPFSNQVY